MCVLSCLVQPQTLKSESCANPIACENEKSGEADWDIDGIGDPTIQGFATTISVNVGQPVTFKVSTDALRYRIDIYRVGYYRGAGARKVTTVQPGASSRIQPPCLTEPRIKLVDCGNWAVSASWDVPPDAVSGVYIARLVREDTQGASHVIFVVRDDSRPSDVLFKTSDETWQAYNPYGGNSLQGGDNTWDLAERAYQVSYNRPFYTRRFDKAAWFFGAEYAMVRWLEANGYDVAYRAGVDFAMAGSPIGAHRVLLSAGRDEYMSGAQRANLEAARDAGAHLAFFSGSVAFWKTNWADSIDGSNTPLRTLVCYKETLDNARSVSDPLNWTGAWRDLQFRPPSDKAQPENSLTGSLFMVNTSNANLAIEVPASLSRLRFWRNTSVQGSDVAVLPGGSLGPRWSADIDNGFRPAGLLKLSSVKHSLADGVLQDNGGRYGAGETTHSITIYRAASGALVFGAGTERWAWGLDERHDGKGFPSDARMQQSTVNLLADMDVQPATPQPSISLASKSSDTAPPTATITGPASTAYGLRTSISGTAADIDGVVALVEVSLDAGASWKPATGVEHWTYEWTPLSFTGSATILARAIDDSGNVQSIPAALTLNVTGGMTIWPNAEISGITLSDETRPVELGMKFRSDVAGYITAVRFYKGPRNTGAHIGSLWTSDGIRQASVTFTNETASGWQQALFLAPVRIAAGRTYVASYYAPNGGYAIRQNFFNTAADTPPLRGLADGADGPNGVFLYGEGGGFPNESYLAANYWVDVVFYPAVGSLPSAVLSWTPSTSLGISGYNIYRSTQESGPYRKLTATPVAESAYVDETILPGQTYYYVTTAVSLDAGESSYSNEAAAKAPPQ